MQLLSLKDVHANPRQPRQDFDQDSLKSLADSIAKSGMMQPIVVRPDQKGGYQIIAGERRWRASQLLGLERIHAVIRYVDDRTAAQFSLVENLQREDLNPMERAEAFQRLIDEFGLMHQEIAESVGLDRSSVTNHLRLNELDDFSKDAVRADRLTLGHAKALLALANNERRRALATQAVQQAWSVRELERRAKLVADGIGNGGGAKDSDGAPAKPITMHPHMADLQKRLGEHLGTKVHIRPGRTKGSGKLIIDFFNLDQFEGLMNRLQFESD
jgi:ParB family chromosome partitioning protein